MRKSSGVRNCTAVTNASYNHKVLAQPGEII
jgi:hypothetical protein